jgi:hypothetical protein
MKSETMRISEGEGSLAGAGTAYGIMFWQVIFHKIDHSFSSTF